MVDINRGVTVWPESGVSVYGLTTLASMEVDPCPSFVSLAVEDHHFEIGVLGFLIP